MALWTWFRRNKTGQTALPRIDTARRFNLQSRVGNGSMSKTWRALDTQTGRQVCLKLLDKEQLEQLFKRFTGLVRPHEGEIAISLKHPHIVQTFEYGINYQDEHFLVMELVDGLGLNFLVETKHGDLNTHALEYLVMAADALTYFHEQGYIHRDICPRNVLVRSDHVVKLIDFGLAVPNKPEFRRPGNRTGTVHYMAPELIRRAPTDQRLDIYSFAVMAYETLTCELPWERAQSMQAMLQHINQPPRDPRELRPDLDDRLVKILLRGLKRNPAERYQTMAEMAADLRAVAGTLEDAMEE